MSNEKTAERVRYLLENRETYLGELLKRGVQKHRDMDDLASARRTQVQDAASAISHLRAIHADVRLLNELLEDTLERLAEDEFADISRLGESLRASFGEKSGWLDGTKIKHIVSAGNEISTLQREVTGWLWRLPSLNDPQFSPKPFVAQWLFDRNDRDCTEWDGRCFLTGCCVWAQKDISSARMELLKHVSDHIINEHDCLIPYTEDWFAAQRCLLNTLTCGDNGADRLDEHGAASIAMSVHVVAQRGESPTERALSLRVLRAEPQNKEEGQ